MVVSKLLKQQYKIPWRQLANAICRIVHTVYVKCPKKASSPGYTDKKENQIFLIYKEIQSRAVGKSCMRKGFLICEEMRKYFPIYEEAVSHI